MATRYRLFYVTTWQLVPGRSAEVRAWHSKAMRLWERLPGVRSIETYAPQFELGAAARTLEVWTEIEDYGVLDRWDDTYAELADDFLALAKQAAGCVHQGPSRLMGSYVGSTVSDLRAR